MMILKRNWLGLAVLLGLGLGANSAEAQFFGLSYNSPGLSIGVNQPAYYGSGYYPPPVVVQQPIVVAPQPVIVAPRPYYGGYGHRGGGYYGGGYGGSYQGGYTGGHHGGYPGGHHGGYPGGHHGGYPGGGYGNGPHRPYY